MSKTFENTPPVERSAFIRELKELCARHGLDRPNVIVGFGVVAVDIRLPSEVRRRLVNTAVENGGFHHGGFVSTHLGSESLAERLNAIDCGMVGGPTVMALGPPCEECGDIDSHAEGCSQGKKYGLAPFEYQSGEPSHCVICNSILPPGDNGLCELHQYDEKDAP